MIFKTSLQHELVIRFAALILFSWEIVYIFHDIHLRHQLCSLSLG